MRPKLLLILILSVSTTAHRRQDETRWKAQTGAGYQAYQQGRFSEAEHFLAAAVREAEKFGPQDPRLGASLYSLALLYQAQGKYAEAEPLYERALAIVEKAVGPRKRRSPPWLLTAWPESTSIRGPMTGRSLSSGGP